MATVNSIFETKGDLSDKHFSKFAETITANLGIRMPDKKKQMLKCRLLRRIRALSMSSFDEYYKYVFNKGGLQSEMQEFINAVTTNKTEFFREAKHFDYLTKTAIPTLLSHRKADGTIPNIKLWCAGCSSGEEPYTLAIVLSEYSRKHNIQFSIIASDISTRVLKLAATGVYPEERVENFSMELKKRYLLKSKNRLKKQVRFSPEIRQKIYYKQLNFMDESYDRIPDNLDIIFFRNVMIYFDPETQSQVLNRMAPKLKKNGFLFTGHSESLKDLRIPFKPVTTAVYKRK